MHLKLRFQDFPTAALPLDGQLLHKFLSRTLFCKNAGVKDQIHRNQKNNGLKNSKCLVIVATFNFVDKIGILKLLLLSIKILIL